MISKHRNKKSDKHPFSHKEPGAAGMVWPEVTGPRFNMSRNSKKGVHNANTNKDSFHA